MCSFSSIMDTLSLGQYTPTNGTCICSLFHGFHSWQPLNTALSLHHICLAHEFTISNHCPLMAYFIRHVTNTYHVTPRLILIHTPLCIAQHRSMELFHQHLWTKSRLGLSLSASANTAISFLVISPSYPTELQ